MDGNTILKQSSKASYEVVAGEAILIHLDSGTYFSLNKVGTELWQMLDGRATLQAHAAVVAAKYGVELARVVGDFVELGERLLAEGLAEAV